MTEDGTVKNCPEGKEPVKSGKEKNRYTATFDIQHCKECSRISECLVKSGKRGYYLRYKEKDVRVAKRRIYEQTPEFHDKYRYRAGIEATMSYYDRKTGVKRLRVRGLKAVSFSATLKAIGVNLFRAVAFKNNETECKVLPETGSSCSCRLYLRFQRTIFIRCNENPENIRLISH